jgi:hypothetical protein
MWLFYYVYIALIYNFLKHMLFYLDEKMQLKLSIVILLKKLIGVDLIEVLA